MPTPHALDSATQASSRCEESQAGYPAQTRAGRQNRREAHCVSPARQLPADTALGVRQHGPVPH